MTIGVIPRLTSVAAALTVGMCAVNVTAETQAESVPVKETRTATVRIIPVYVVNGDELGNDVDVDLFQSRGEKTNFAERFHRGSATEIPYGTYTARIHVRGFPSVERVVKIGQPNAAVVVGLQIAVEGHIPTSDISGRIRGIDPAAGSVRVRLAGVYSDDVFDAEAKAEEFFFGTVPHGHYILAVTQAGRTLGTRAIKVPSESPIVIEIFDTKSGASK
ncbi:MAG: hypothetical protein LAO23_08555 [Acidobacteriia bacterium]|nr:hypothetical protein [Terriglobia bacterium]